MRQLDRRMSIRSGPGILLALASALLCFAIVPDNLKLIGESMPGFLVWDNGVIVSFHRGDWTGAQTGINSNGGILVGVGDREFESGRALVAETKALEPGQLVRYQVRSGGSTESISIPTMRLDGLDWISTFGIYLLNGVVLLFAAVLALILRLDLPAARAFALAAALVGAGLVLATDYFSTYKYVEAFRFVEAVATAAVLNLALVFPRVRLRPRLRIAASLLVGVLLLGLQFGLGAEYASDPVWSRQSAVWVYFTASIAVMILVYNHAETLLRPRSADEQSRTAVVCAGSLPAFSMAAFGMLAFTLFGWTFSWSWVFALMPIASLSMIYAMTAQNLFDAERVVRLGLGYGAATFATVALFGTGLAAIDHYLETSTREGSAPTMLLLLIIALGFDPLRRRIQESVDRAFFRSSLDFAKALQTFSQEIQTLRTQPEIARAVGSRIASTLQLEFATLELGAAEPREAPIQQAVSFRGERLGTLVGGPKRSGSTFAREEIDVVKAFADQAALALNNARTIEELKRAEERLRIRERLAAIGEFAGAVAHGIRNPLAGIRAGIDVAKRLDDVEDVRTTLENVSSEANRLENRIRSLLNLSRPYEIQLDEIDVRRLIEEVVSAMKPFAEQSGVSIETRVPEHELLWRLDADLFTEALLELSKNSVESMPDGGVLSIEASADTATQQLIVCVRDTGPGVSEDHVDRIFDLFYTTRPNGTGIGLANVRKIIESLGGQIRLDRTAPDNFGASFRIQLSEQ